MIESINHSPPPHIRDLRLACQVIGVMWKDRYVLQPYIAYVDVKRRAYVEKTKKGRLVQYLGEMMESYGRELAKSCVIYDNGGTPTPITTARDKETIIEFLVRNYNVTTLPHRVDIKTADGKTVDRYL
jgi:hypothetical protein